MKMTKITVDIMVGIDDETEAERCVQSSLENLMGGDLSSFNIVGTELITSASTQS